ncbi:STE20/SPS1-related proline-alanine-rich protein kinase-like isoform X2 [Hibiscus syriacus]|uniref:STE20/SPS1-related proline-alanine-rich protein kinase-like isoform X2 n=1 Tax=Hibiscus syriacus TaxID=106335 RepID=UPI00192314F0|nr:STE20/SPS1-related proline-alanine-rich protein kinase-like isoform X2 [Hibiscus syriacus]
MVKKKYPIGPEFYTLHEAIGQGVSASVHRAVCLPFDEVVAIKILDFERDNCDLNNVFHEAQTMVSVEHPNVLKSHCSFVSDHNLWVVMPYMAGGSCLNILKVAYPDGFEEVVIATILREVLKGLEYLHHHGHIHRDVKAGNILIDSRGAIKLGDFGVSACMFDSGDRQRMRNTFVGTPCWMAPEVMEQVRGYDFKADIWSFGITALELAHGHAPFSKYPPMKVLLMTLQNAPPGLDYERDGKFSKSFKQMIASCLVKDPSKRPTSKNLLKHSFFKQARSNDYVARTLLDALPPLGVRIQELKRKEEDMLAQKKMPDGQKEELSQNEYKRGISGWNFNLEDMKTQASLIQDEGLITETSQGGSSSSLCTLDVQDKQLEFRTSSQATDKEDNDLVQNQPASFAAVEATVNFTRVRSERSNDESSAATSLEPNLISPYHDVRSERNLVEKPVLEFNGKPSDNTTKLSHQRTGTFSGSINIPETNVLLIKESNKQSQPINSSSGDGVSIPAGEDTISELSSKASKSPVNSYDFDEKVNEKVKPPVVQQRGRFKVTSENVHLEKVVAPPALPKSHSMKVRNSEVLIPNPMFSLGPSSGVSPLTPAAVSSTPPSAPSTPAAVPSTPAAASSTSAATSPTPASSLFPLCQSVLQANILQRENILNVMKHICAGDSIANRAFEGVCMPAAKAAVTEKSLLEEAHDREKELRHEIAELQWRYFDAICFCFFFRPNFTIRNEKKNLA